MFLVLDHWCSNLYPLITDLLWTTDWTHQADQGSLILIQEQLSCHLINETFRLALISQQQRQQQQLTVTVMSEALEQPSSQKWINFCLMSSRKKIHSNNINTSGPMNLTSIISEQNPNKQHFPKCHSTPLIRRQGTIGIQKCVEQLLILIMMYSQTPSPECDSSKHRALMWNEAPLAAICCRKYLILINKHRLPPPLSTGPHNRASTAASGPYSHTNQCGDPAHTDI